MPDYFKNVEEIGNCLPSEQIETNVVFYLNWGLLNIGSFFNVTIPTSGSYGGNQHILRLSEDPNYTKGQVWEGFRKDWVWESGLNYSVQPISISGVYINGAYVPASSVGQYSHKIDYPNGRIIFDSAISSNTQVSCEYSYRYIQVNNIDNSPWFKRLQFDSFRVDDSHFNLYGSGSWSLHPSQRLQLPTIVIRSIPNAYKDGYEIGNNSLWNRQEFHFYLLAETNNDLMKMFDVITLQKDSVIRTFDKNELRNNDDFPLKFDGSIGDTSKTYPQLADAYPGKTIRFVDFKGIAFDEQLPFYASTLRGLLEVIVP